MWWLAAAVLAAPADRADAIEESAFALYDEGKLAAAEVLFQQVLTLREEEGDPEMVAAALINLGLMVAEQGRLDEAASHYEQARLLLVGLPERDLATEAAVSNNLGFLRLAQGETERAEALLAEAAEAFAASDQPLEAAIGRNNLGMLANRDGRFREARGHFQQALALYPDPDEPGPDLPRIRQNLAVVCSELGDYRAAREHYQQALDEFALTLGAAAPDTAWTQVNLAVLLGSQGNLAAALRLMEPAVDVLAASELADERPGRALLQLAHLLLEQGLPELARERLFQARNRLPPHAAAYRANVLVSQGLVSMELGDLRAAEDQLERGVLALVGVHGEDHPMVAKSLLELAKLRLKQDRQAEAHTAALQAVRILERQLGGDHPEVADALVVLANTVVEGPERRALLDRALLVRTRGMRLVEHLSAEDAAAWLGQSRTTLHAWLSGHSEARYDTEAYGHVLRWKGGFLRQLRAQRRSRGHSAEARAVVEELGAVRRLLVVASRSAREGATVDALVAQEAELERELVALTGPVRSEGEATLSQVCAALAEDEALVDLVATRDSEVGLTYTAFVVRSDCSVRRIRLGEAPDLHGPLSRWLALLDDPASLSVRIDAVGAELTRRVWTPLELGDVARVWWVADGLLSHLSPAALPLQWGYVVEGWEIGVLEQAQDLLRPPATPGQGALLVGDVDYGRPQGEPTPCAPAWTPLPGTAGELEAVAALARRAPMTRRAGVRQLRGEAATAEAVRDALPGSGVVHLATHGFFLDTACVGLSGRGARSGLALAGANNDPTALWTGADLVGLDLDGVQLVALSACDTGLGALSVNEGPDGLRRALAAAGARQLLMGLWSVPDEPTRALMVEVYQRYLGRRGGDAVAALAAAQRAALAENLSWFGEARPQDWGAWVVSGG